MRPLLPIAGFSLLTALTAVLALFLVATGGDRPVVQHQDYSANASETGPPPWLWQAGLRDLRIPDTPPPWSLAPTPTPTPNPEPTPVPEPTPAPLVAEEPVYQEPAPGGGSCMDAAALYPWDLNEAAYIIDQESDFNPWALNPTSGACGCFQTLGCVGLGDPYANAAEAYRKWSACGGSFWCDWYRWWP